MLNRRQWMTTAAAGLAGLSWAGVSGAAPAAERALITKAIPRSGERIPVVGMGTWRTFNVGDAPDLVAARSALFARFLELGGGMVDSSPMYGSAQAVLGKARAALPDARALEALFSADKIWTSDGGETRAQLEEIGDLWGLPRFDLMQIHNLRAWSDHLPTLRRLKAEGRLRYIGITTSHGRRHGDLARIMATEPLDFVQLTYDITHRAVEDRLLPLARDKGIAVIVNRPYDGGASITRLKRSGAKVPAWAVEAGMPDWASFLLKWIVAHPAVTVAIPATSRLGHLAENMAAGRGRLPDAATRERMVKHLAAL